MSVSFIPRSLLHLYVHSGEMSLMETSTTISLLKNHWFTDPTRYTRADISTAACPNSLLSRISNLGEWHHHHTQSANLEPQKSPVTASSSFLPNPTGHQTTLFFFLLLLLPLPSFSPPYSMPFLVQAHIISCLNFAWACKLVSLPLGPSLLPLKLLPLPIFHLTQQSHQNDLHFPVFSHVRIFMSLCLEYSTSLLLIYHTSTYSLKLRHHLLQEVLSDTLLPHHLYWCPNSLWSLKNFV